MRPETKKTLGIAAGVVVVVVLVLALWFKFTNVERYRYAIEAELSAATGYELDIDGKMSIKLLPLSISITGLRLRNPKAFAQSAQNFLYVPECRVGLKFVPMLSKKLKVTNITLYNPELNLIRDNDGNANWDFGVMDDTGGGVLGHKALISQMVLNLAFSELKVNNGRIVYNDKRGFGGGALTMEDVELTAKPFNGPQNRLNFEFKAKANKVPINIQGYTTETLEQILATDWPEGVQLYFINNTFNLSK